MIHLFTSITANYIPKARVLATSLKQFHPEAQFHLVLCDRLPESVTVAREPFDSIITIEELPIPQLKSWIFKHSIVEMCTGVKGIAFQEIIRRYHGDKILYFDPDIVILSKLDSILDRLDSYSILLTPHQTVPDTDNQAIIDNEICSLKHGVYNLGFLAIRNSQAGRRFLDWWSKRCLDFCYNNIPGGLFTDQRWVDLAPAFFEDIHILREPIYNVATWNLTHRTAVGSIKQGILVNNQPLCFYHFSGFDKGDQEIMLKKYGISSPVLFELRQWYIEQCSRMGQEKFGKLPCVYVYFDSGELITQEQRLLYRQRLDLQQAYRDPFFVSDTFDTSRSYFHWYAAHGQNEFIGGLYNYSNSEQALIQAQTELEQLRAMIAGMESSKFWKLRNAWFRVKRSSKLLIKIFEKLAQKVEQINKKLVKSS